MRFLVANDHSIVRMGIRLMLESDYADVTVDEAENGNRIVESIKMHDYDLIILDFQMPNTDTFGIINYLLSGNKNLKILIYTMASEKVYASKLLDAGVKGFLSKEAENTELLKAVAVILNNGKYTCQHTLTDTEQDGLHAANPFASLINKEMDILNYLIQGKSTKEISSLVNLQLSTVSTPKARIFNKLRVENIVELVALAKAHILP